MRNRRRRVGIVGIIGLLGLSVIGVGIAWAAWSRTETGPAKGKARTMSFTVNTATANADLYPSASATGSVTFSIENDNPFAIEVTQVQGNGAVETGDAGCLPATITVGTVVMSEQVPANGTATITVDNVLTMATDAPDACQGLEFTVPLNVTAVQVVAA